MIRTLDHYKSLEDEYLGLDVKSMFLDSPKDLNYPRIALYFEMDERDSKGGE